MIHLSCFIFSPSTPWSTRRVSHLHIICGHCWRCILFPLSRASSFLAMLPLHNETFDKSLNHLPVHQPAATNSMHLYSTHNRHLQHLWSDQHLKSDQRPVMELFDVFRPLTVFVEELRCWCLATQGFHRVSTTGNLELLLPPNSPDSYQSQIQ